MSIGMLELDYVVALHAVREGLVGVTPDDTWDTPAGVSWTALDALQARDYVEIDLATDTVRLTAIGEAEASPTIGVHDA